MSIYRVKYCTYPIFFSCLLLLLSKRIFPQHARRWESERDREFYSEPQDWCVLEININIWLLWYNFSILTSHMFFLSLVSAVGRGFSQCDNFLHFELYSYFNFGAKKYYSLVAKYLNKKFWIIGISYEETWWAYNFEH